MGTVWALYGHCMGTYKKPHEANVSHAGVNKLKSDAKCEYGV